MNKIILISGKATNGKDALGEHLKRKLEEQGEVVVIDRFAKYIKSYLKDYYGWDGIIKDDKVRSRLQALGTDIIKERLNYKSFHAKRLAEDIQINSDYIDTFIIADTRFRDEIYMMKAMFPDETITVRVNRHNHKSNLTDEQLKHKSECDLDDFNFDYVVDTYNNTLEELYNKGDEILNKIRSDFNDK